MRAIRLLALRRLRLQPARALLAALVVGGGASLVVTILVITASLERSVEEAGRALAGPAPLRILGPLQRGGLGTDVVSEVEDVDGVRAVIPLIQAISEVDPGGDEDAIGVTVLGFDCSVTTIIPAVGEDQCDDALLAGLTAPLIGSRLAEDLGPGATIRTNQGRIPLEDAIALDGLDTINAGRVVAFPMAQAQDQLGRDGVDVAYVLVEDGASVPGVERAIEDLLPEDHRVLDALDPPPVIGVILSTFLPLFTVIALLTLGIGGILVRNSITLSLEERRRQTAVVGALGGSRRLLVGGTLLEAVVLGAVGGLLGDAFGIVLAGPVSGGLEDITQDIAGIPLDIHVPGIAVVAGVFVGVATALLVSVGPARRAVRVDVAAELASRARREDVARSGHPVRVLLAAVLIAVGMGVATISAYQGGIERWRSSLAPVGFLICTVGGVALVTVAVPILLGALERRGRFRRGASRLAVSNLRREPRRSAVMALALGFAMGVGFVTASFNASVTQAIREQLDRELDGVQVSSIDPNNSATSEARLSPEVLEGLAEIDGVEAVQTGAIVVVGNTSGSLIGVQAYTDPWISDGRFDALGRTTRAGLDDGEVTVGPALARSDELRPGDLVRVATPDGPVRLPVMAVVYDGNFGGRNITMSYERLVDLFGDQAPVSVIVQPEDGVSDTELKRRIEAADLDPDLIVEDKEEVVERNAEAVAEQLSVFDAIQRGLLLMSFVAVLSTLLLVGIQRQREFGMLAAVGMTPPELKAMVRWEAAIVALLGVLVTGIAAVAQYYALNEIVPVIIGYRDPFVLAPASFVVYGLIAVATAVLASLYPARRASRVEVLEALRYE